MCCDYNHVTTALPKLAFFIEWWICMIKTNNTIRHHAVLAFCPRQELFSEGKEEDLKGNGGQNCFSLIILAARSQVTPPPARSQWKRGFVSVFILAGAWKKSSQRSNLQLFCNTSLAVFLPFYLNYFQNYNHADQNQRKKKTIFLSVVAYRSFWIPHGHIYIYTGNGLLHFMPTLVLWLYL